jgi:hypothetical protein
VRLARPERALDIEILSLVPRVMPDPEDLSTVAFTAPDRLELHRASGYLNSYLERALQGPPVRFRPGQRIERSNYAISVLDAPDGKIQGFAVELADPEHTLVLARQDGDLEPLRPSSPH